MSDIPSIWPRLQLAENFTVKFAPGGAIRIEQLQDGTKVDVWLELEQTERLMQELMHQAQQRIITRTMMKS
jgi:hypothetical protein